MDDKTYLAEIKGGYKNKLKGMLFSLLCEFEEKREWKKFLDSIIIEIAGFPDKSKTINYYKLFFKISMLKYLSYEYFRKTIFDCISLVEDLEV